MSSGTFTATSSGIIATGLMTGLSILSIGLPSRDAPVAEPAAAVAEGLPSQDAPVAEPPAAAAEPVARPKPQKPSRVVVKSELSDEGNSAFVVTSDPITDEEYAKLVVAETHGKFNPLKPSLHVQISKTKANIAVFDGPWLPDDILGEPEKKLIVRFDNQKPERLLGMVHKGEYKTKSEWFLKNVLKARRVLVRVEDTMDTYEYLISEKDSHEARKYWESVH